MKTNYTKVIQTMEIHEYLRSQRMKKWYRTYEAMAEKARALGHNTSSQALNKAERIPQYLTPATKSMYCDVLDLSDTERDLLDVLAARCQIRKGSNTNPYMTVVDTRIYQNVVDESCDMVLRLVSDIISRKDSLSSSEKELLKSAIKGALCQPISRLKENL